MTATELDLQVLFSPDQIRRREFVTVRRGYDPDQVRDYLDQLADQVQRMGMVIKEARLEAGTAVGAQPQPRSDAYDRLSTRLASLLREADATAERLVSEARAEADRVLAEARAEADRIRADASARAEEAGATADRTLREARESADRTIAGLATQRDALVRQLAQMQERLLGVAQELEVAIETPPVAPAVEDEPPAAGGETGRDASVDPQAARVAAQNGALFEVPADPSYEELWEGTESFHLQVPDIPPLDLSWDEDEGADS